MLQSSRKLATSLAPDRPDCAVAKRGFQRWPGMRTAVLAATAVCVTFVHCRPVHGASSWVIASCDHEMVNSGRKPYSISQPWMSSATSTGYVSWLLAPVIDGAMVHVLSACAPAPVLPPSSCE